MQSVTKKKTTKQIQDNKCHEILPTQTNALPIESMGLVYLPTFVVDFYGFHVGKYARQPWIRHGWLMGQVTQHGWHVMTPV